MLTLLNPSLPCWAVEKIPGHRDLGRREPRASSSCGPLLPALGLALASGPRRGLGCGEGVQQYHAALGKAREGGRGGQVQPEAWLLLPTPINLRAVSSRTWLMPGVKPPSAKCKGCSPQTFAHQQQSADSSLALDPMEARTHLRDTAVPASVPTAPRCPLSPQHSPAPGGPP